MARQRLDRALLTRGLVSSTGEATEVIAQGRVLVSGSSASNASRLVSPAEPIVLAPSAARFVGRGGLKLERALTRFEIVPDGRSALDAGSATGGFTDCLLQYGAAAVVAVDVGYGQLHERLRGDPRVHSMERTNIREVTLEAVAPWTSTHGAISLVTADLSFTSLRPLVPVLLALTTGDGDLVLLCKPQFEVDHAVASRGRGVISQRQDRRQALGDLSSTLLTFGAAIMGVVASPILGPAGNAEFLLHVRPSGLSSPNLDHEIDVALDEAEALR